MHMRIKPKFIQNYKTCTCYAHSFATVEFFYLGFVFVRFRVQCVKKHFSLNVCQRWCTLSAYKIRKDNAIQMQTNRCRCVKCASRRPFQIPINKFNINSTKKMSTAICQRVMTKELNELFPTVCFSFTGCCAGAFFCVCPILLGWSVCWFPCFINSFRMKSVKTASSTYR